MRMLSQEVINAQVARGIQKNTESQTHWQLKLGRFDREFGLAQLSKGYRDLQGGELSYRMYLFVKD